MAETFNAYTGQLFAVYHTDIAEGITYVDALYWDGNEGKTQLIIGQNTYSGDTEMFAEKEMIEIPREAKQAVLEMMYAFEGESPLRPNTQLTLNEVYNLFPSE